MVHMDFDDDLVDDVRPYVETDWEKKQREEKGVKISATEVMERLAQWFWGVKAGFLAPPQAVRDSQESQPHKRARLYGRRPR